MRTAMLSALLYGVITVSASAEPTTQEIGTMADQITGNFTSLSKMITVPAYAMGAGYAAGSVLKFKAQNRPRARPHRR